MRARPILRGLLAALFFTAGVAHFLTPEPFVRLIDGMLPAPRELVAFTGMCELAGAIGLLLPKTRRAASWALVVFLIAVFPANVRMAVERIPMDGVSPLPDWQAYLRLPIQGLLVGWAWWAGRD